MADAAPTASNATEKDGLKRAGEPRDRVRCAVAVAGLTDVAQAGALRTT